MRNGFYRGLAALLAGCLLLGGCAAKQQKRDAAEQVQQQLSKSYQTTARVKYKELQTVMTIYKKPMNCAIVTFESPDSLKDMKMTFYTDKIAFNYKDMNFDFEPGSLPGKAASKLVVSALNAAMEGQGISVRQEDSRIVLDGKMEEGAFSLVANPENGNILKLSIPSQELELEILNFKLLE